MKKEGRILALLFIIGIILILSVSIVSASLLTDISNFFQNIFGAKKDKNNLRGNFFSLGHGAEENTSDNSTNYSEENDFLNITDNDDNLNDSSNITPSIVVKGAVSAVAPPCTCVPGCQSGNSFCSNGAINTCIGHLCGGVGPDTCYSYTVTGNCANGCDPIRGGCKVDSGCTSGSTKQCSIGSCAGTQTCSGGVFGSCVKTNPNCNDGTGCTKTPSCENKLCGASDGCYGKCFGSCTSGKVCDTNSLTCIDKNECDDPDNTITKEGYYDFKSYLVKTIVTSTNILTGVITKLSDKCPSSTTIAEAYCNDWGNIQASPKPCPDDKPYCQEGQCVECAKNSDCKDLRKNICDLNKNNPTYQKCICKQTKTCKDYPNQCGKFFDDGCDEYGLDCSNNCPKGKYCDILEGRCVATPSKDCCVCSYQGLWNTKCSNFNNKEACNRLSIGVGGPCNWNYATKKCENSMEGECKDILKNAKPACQRSAVLESIESLDKYTSVNDIREFFANNNCATRRVFFNYHAWENTCLGPLYDTISACMACNKGLCNSYGFYHAGCDVFKNEDNVNKLVSLIQNDLKEAGDEVTTVDIKASRTFTTGCTFGTWRTIHINKNFMDVEDFPCSEQQGKSCLGEQFPELRKKTFTCSDENKKSKILKCCNKKFNYNGDSDFGYISNPWTWELVSSETEECSKDILNCNDVQNKKCNLIMNSNSKYPCKDANSNKNAICCPKYEVQQQGFIRENGIYEIVNLDSKCSNTGILNCNNIYNKNCNLYVDQNNYKVPCKDGTNTKILMCCSREKSKKWTFIDPNNPICPRGLASLSFENNYIYLISGLIIIVILAVLTLFKYKIKKKKQK